MIEGAICVLYAFQKKSPLTALDQDVEIMIRARVRDAGTVSVLTLR